MKKSILFMAMLLIGMISWAQEPEPEFKKNRIYAGGSLYNTVSASLIALGQSGSSSSFMFGYERFFNDRWSMEISFYAGIVSVSGIPLDGTNDRFNADIVHTNILLGGHYSYLNRQGKKYHNRLYSGLALGSYGAAISVSDNRGNSELGSASGLGFQLDAIGWEQRGKWFGGWVELGYGNQGIFQVGLSASF